jgi:hypothetical protein
VRVKFHNDRLRRSKVNRGGGLNIMTHGQQGDLTCVIVFQNKGTRLKNQSLLHKITPHLRYRLMLFSEIIPPYCKNRTKHTTALCGQNAESIQ